MWTIVCKPPGSARGKSRAVVRFSPSVLRGSDRVRLGERIYDAARRGYTVRVKYVSLSLLLRPLLSLPLLRHLDRLLNFFDFYNKTLWVEVSFERA
jgi:hypothetical protein